MSWADLRTLKCGIKDYIDNHDGLMINILYPIIKDVSGFSDDQLHQIMIEHWDQLINYNNTGQLLVTRTINANQEIADMATELIKSNIVEYIDNI